MPRYALYYCPPPVSALWQFGSAVLGYDAERAMAMAHPELSSASVAQFARWSQTPRRYGFHATLKAPFHLRAGHREDDLIHRVAERAVTLSPVALGRLQVAAMGRFVALVPAVAHRAVSVLATACVELLEEMRAPLTPADRERRLASGLTARQTALLERYGYPYVCEEFRFHMTLTGALESGELEAALSALRTAYRAIDDPVVIDAITVVRQDAPDAHFAIIGRWPLTGDGAA